MFPPRTFRRLGLPLVVGVAIALLGAPAPAQADVTGSTSTGDVVLYGHCQDHVIDYDLLVSPGTAFWRLEVQVFGPDGTTSEGTVANSTMSPTKGSVTVQFCGSETPGTYTVRGTGFYEVLPAVQIPFALPETTFQVRPAATRTTLTRTSLGPRRDRLRIGVREQSEQGWSPAIAIPVRLERREDGRWVRVRGLTLTTVRGTATAVLSSTSGGKIRAVVAARGNHGASASRSVTLGG